MKHRVAVIGSGYWGVNHVRNFNELGALAAVCDTSQSKLQQIRERYPGLRLEADFDRLLADPEIDAVSIATPAQSHYWMAEAAIRAGKDVLVEKPLCLRYSDGVKLVELARQRERILMVGHLLEYHPAVLKLKELVDSKELGRVQYIYSNRLNLGRIRREENILWSFAPHDIAVILRLIGDMPFEVTATGGAYLQPNIADVTVTNLLFDNGVRAHIFVSWLHPYKEQRLVVIGSKKMAVFDAVAPTDNLVVYDQGVDWINGEIVTRKNAGEPVQFEPIEPLRSECQHFLDCIETRATPRTDGINGLQVLRVLQACQRSLQTHGQPVQLTLSNFEVAGM